jgi:hypothetical protein
MSAIHVEVQVLPQVVIAAQLQSYPVKKIFARPPSQPFTWMCTGMGAIISTAFPEISSLALLFGY